MFDQKWLKRYMLQNRPAEEDVDATGGGGAKPPKTPEPSGQRPPQRPPESPPPGPPPPGARPPQAAGEEAAEVVAVYEVTCPRCGNVYMSDAHFCRKCGHRRLEASVVVPRPSVAEAGGRLPAPAPAPSRMYSSEPPRAAYPAGQQRTPPPPGPAAASPSPMGYTGARYFTPEAGGGKYPAAAQTPQMALEAQPPPMATVGVDTSHDGRANYFVTGADRNRDGIPDAMQAPAPGSPSGAGPWPMMGGGFFGPYGQFPYDANANMYNVWPTNYGSEAGAKNYVVLCKDDVEVRASPTYADDARIGHLLHPGQVVVVDERRMVSGSWFLHLADGRGWVFETKERLLVMTEVQEFERGLWHYSVVCEDDVETRMSPTYSDDARTSIVLGSGDTVAIDERCRVAGARFLKLADGRGWVFETRDRLLVFSEVRCKPQEARDFERGLWHYTVVCDDDVEIRAAPTYSDEARTGLMVHPGDCVAIDERCRVAAVWYLRLADGRGWVFESKDSRRVMMQLH